MIKQIYFLAGLPRAGSTLLGSILNQHPMIHVTPTSPTLDIVCKLEEYFNELTIQFTFDRDTTFKNVSKSIFTSMYQHIDKPFIFDKHRGWPENTGIAKKTLNTEIKGIVTHRPIPEVITSFIKLFDKDPNNWVDRALRENYRPINNRNRADYLWRNNLIKAVKPHSDGSIDAHLDKFLFLSYDEIVLNTKNTLGKIEEFFGIPGISDLVLVDIVNTCGESKDEAWGVNNLHTIRPIIQKTSDDARVTLGPELYDFYSNFNIKVT